MADASVESYGFWEGYNWVWTFSWKRALRPQDIIEKSRLDCLLKEVCLAYEGDDELVWAFHSSGKFTTKSFTHELDKLSPVTHHDAVKGVWRGLVPHRIEVFVWSALLERINSRQKLAHLGIIPTENDVCVLCSQASESSNHLLLHCIVAQQLWCWWLEMWGIKWVFPANLKVTFEQWQSPLKSPFFKKVWHTCFFVIVWTIWKERNARIFEGSSSSVKFLQDMILLRIGWWIKGWCEEFPYSPNDIQRNPECLKWNGSLASLSNLQAAAMPCVWCPPESNQIKWNVDASMNPQTLNAAIGGVLRNEKGEFKCLFSSPIPFMEINSAEILAIHHAIKISLASDITKNHQIILESDSANAVLWCNSANGGPWNMSHHLNFIRNAIKKDLSIKIVHKGRNANFVADNLAKQGLLRDEEFIAWI